MKYFRDISLAPRLDNSIVTIGIFDGIHLGHRAILSEMKRLKEIKGGDIVVITFYPHPRQIIENKQVSYIHSQGRKIDFLANLGVDILIDIPFTKEFSHITTQSFLEDYIIKTLNPSHIVVGYDCHFGHGNEPTLKILNDNQVQFGYETIVVPPVYYNEQIVSSSLIRHYLKQGDVETANAMLGYEYYIYGQVVYGQQLGRTIGFPTVNLFLENNLKLITSNGVYACRIKWHGELFDGMCNIGTRPTVNGIGVTIEVNIFDFDKDIYGENICIYFYKRIRVEEIFSDLRHLKYQLEQDRQMIKDFFKDKERKLSSVISLSCC